MIHKIGNFSIPVDPGISLSLLLSSPLFDNSDGKTPGSFIFNQKMPATPELRAAFGQGHRTTLDGRATSELPYLFQEGSLRFTGTCLLQEANELEYEILYNVRNGDFAYEASGISLKDLDLGGDRYLADVYSIAVATNVFFYDLQTHPFIKDTLLPNIILSDFTSSLTDDGRTFTAPHDIRCTQKIILSPAFATGEGALYLNCYKNGINYIEERYFSESDIRDITTILNLVAGDIITIELIAESYESEGGHEISILISNFKVEYIVENGLINIPTCDQNTSDYALFPIKNPNLFDNFPKDEFQIDNVNIQKVYNESFFVQNYWKDGYFPFVLSGYKEGLYIYAMNIFTPFIYISYLLNAIATRLNYELVNQPFSDSSLYFNAVLFNSFAENTYNNDETRMIGVKTTFNLVDHVPDISINTFLNSLCKIVGRRIDIDTENRTLTFVNLKEVIQSTESIPFPGVITESPNVLQNQYNGYKIEFKATTDKFISEQIKLINSKHIYKGSVDNLTDLPVSGNQVNDLFLVIAINAFYVWKYSTKKYLLDWIFHSQNFYITKQTGEEPFLQITSGMAPIIDNIGADNTVGALENRFWRIPVTSQPGNFEGYPDMSAESGLQLLFYKGLYPDSNLENYPLAISGNKDYAGNTFENPNLCLDGPTPNIFSEELAAWLDWLVFNSKPVKLKALMTPAQLSSIRYAKKYRILGNNYLIQEIRVNMIDDHLSEAEIKAYTC